MDPAMSETTPTTPPPAPAAEASCPSCGADVSGAERFCEACGAPLSRTTEALTGAETAATTPAEASRPGGSKSVQEPDGGAVSPRDHYVEQPAAWVAAVCDRGLRHHRNEDATAVAADPEPGSRAVLVVCDGVSTSTDSDVAALAGARSARDVVAAARAVEAAPPASRAAALAQTLGLAAAQANEAVIANTAPESDRAASCTLAAAVLEGDLVVFGTVGDSRVYWLPDAGAGDPLQLSVDDSMAQVRIEMGVDRAQAENGPQAHAITRWLGRDSTDVVPRTGSVTLQVPGWLLVCSDGLWNYCSDAGALQALVNATQAVSGADPLRLAAGLVAWANAQGGRDNISVALARHA